MKMKYNHIGIPTTERFAGEIDVPHLKITVNDHANNPFGIQWQRYWADAPYPELVKTVPHVALASLVERCPSRSCANRGPDVTPVLHDAVRLRLQEYTANNG
jgi:hypothetical protein